MAHVSRCSVRWSTPTVFAGCGCARWTGSSAGPSPSRCKARVHLQLVQRLGAGAETLGAVLAHHDHVAPAIVRRTPLDLGGGLDDEDGVLVDDEVADRRRRAAEEAGAVVARAAPVH